MGFDPVSMGIMAGGSIIGGLISGNSAEEGAKAQAAAARYAADLQHQQYEQNVGILNPFIQPGQAAAGKYADLAGVNGNAAQGAALGGLAHDPFMDAIQKNANDQTLAAAGKSGAGVSGNALNALYSQNAGLFGNFLQTQLGNINNVANRGLSAGSALAGVGASAASAQGNYINQAGQATGAGILGQGNALGNAFNNAGLFGAFARNSTSNPTFNSDTYGGINYTDPFPNMGGDISF